MSHCERGDEYIVGQQAHTYKFEGGGAAVLGSIQLQNHVERLWEDHANARLLAEGLARIEELDIDLAAVQTNMVFISLDRAGFIGLQEGLKKRGILISGREKVRLVTHIDVTRDDLRTVIQAFKDRFSGRYT